MTISSIMEKIEYHRDLKTIVVRTNKKTNFEKKLKKKLILLAVPKVLYLEICLKKLSL